MAEDHSKTTIHAPPGETLSVEVDLETYRPYFEDDNLSDDEKRALIEALFQIMGAFVDLGFGIHPVQTACGQVSGEPSKAPAERGDALYLGQTLLKSNFDTAAESKTLPAAEKAAS